MGTRFFCLIIVAVSIFQLSEQLENNGVNKYSIAGNPGTNVYLHVNYFNPSQSSDSITTPNELKVDQVQILKGINKKIEAMKIKLYEEVDHHLDVSLNEFKTKLLKWADNFGRSVTQKLLKKSKTVINSLDQEANAKRNEFIIDLENYTGGAFEIYKNETSVVSVKLTEQLKELNDKIDSIKIQNVNTILNHNNNNDKVDLLDTKSGDINSIDFSDSKTDSLEAQLASHKFDGPKSKSSFDFGGAYTEPPEAQLESQELGSSITNQLFDFDGSKTDSLEAQLVSHKFDGPKSKSSIDFGGAYTEPPKEQLEYQELGSSKSNPLFDFDGSKTDSLEAQLVSHKFDGPKSKSSIDFGGAYTEPPEAQLESQELGSSKTNPLFDFDGSKTDSLEAQLASHKFDSSKSKSSFDFGGSYTEPPKAQLASHEFASSKMKSLDLNVNSLDSKTRWLESSNSRKHSYDFGDPDIYMYGVDNKVHLSDVDDE